MVARHLLIEHELYNQRCTTPSCGGPYCLFHTVLFQDGFRTVLSTLLVPVGALGTCCTSCLSHSPCGSPTQPILVLCNKATRYFKVDPLADFLVLGPFCATLVVTIVRTASHGLITATNILVIVTRSIHTWFWTCRIF